MLNGRRDSLRRRNHRSYRDPGARSGLNQKFYVDTLGLKFKTTRRNPDGSPRQTYVLAGDNIIGLHLPGRQRRNFAEQRGPRIGISVSSERLAQVEKHLLLAKHPFKGPVEHCYGSADQRSIYFDDPDGNHLEFCVRRVEPRERLHQPHGIRDL